MDTQHGREGDGVSEEAIRQRAFEISQGEDGGTAEENWRRAEEELRGGGTPSQQEQPDQDLPGAASP